jgi:hypothetical protein
MGVNIALQYLHRDPQLLAVSVLDMFNVFFDRDPSYALPSAHGRLVAGRIGGAAMQRFFIAKAHGQPTACNQ